MSTFILGAAMYVAIALVLIRGGAKHFGPGATEQDARFVAFMAVFWFITLPALLVALPLQWGYALFLYWARRS